MPRPTNSDRLAKVHYRAITEFDRIQSALRDERLQCLQDRRFYSLAGAQWEGPLGEQFENKPKFEALVENLIASGRELLERLYQLLLSIINTFKNKYLQPKREI
jgi:hypothetical protein